MSLSALTEEQILDDIRSFENAITQYRAELASRATLAVVTPEPVSTDMADWGVGPMRMLPDETTDLTISERFAAALQEKFPKVESYDSTYDVEKGQRFDRIIQVNNQRSVHAFVEKATGKLVKAATYKAPAKRANGELQSKFNLSTPEGFQAAIDAADRYGSYLYIR